MPALNRDLDQENIVESYKMLANTVHCTTVSIIRIPYQAKAFKTHREQTISKSLLSPVPFDS